MKFWLFFRNRLPDNIEEVTIEAADQYEPEPCVLTVEVPEIEENVVTEEAQPETVEP